MSEFTCELILTVEEPDEINLSYVEAEIKPEQTKNVVPDKSEQTVEPDPGFTLGAVNVAAIPPEYIIPSGTKNITENGDHNVTAFETAHVAVPDPVLQQKTVTPTEQQQTVEADTQQGFDALSRVTVNRIPQEYIVPSDATATAADIAIGKTAYIADGKVTGTNDYVKPTKGVIFKDYDADGYAQTVDIVGFDSSLPNYYLSPGNNNSLRFLNGIKTINIYDAIRSGSYTFQSLRVTTFNVYSNSFKFDLATLSNCSLLKTVYAAGNITMEAQCFQGSNSVELYDFSHCTAIPALSFVVFFGHADGCKIRIPYALSDEYLGVGNGWQSATNWSALPTDPNTSGYVVWEVV